MTDPTAQDDSHHHPEQLVRVASRLFVAYLLSWVVSNLTYIPREVALAIRYARHGSNGESILSASRASYLLHGFNFYLAENMLRTALLLGAAGWFYRCGPRVTSFFTAAPEPAPWWDIFTRRRA